MSCLTFHIKFESNDESLLLTKIAVKITVNTLLNYGKTNKFENVSQRLIFKNNAEFQNVFNSQRIKTQTYKYCRLVEYFFNFFMDYIPIFIPWSDTRAVNCACALEQRIMLYTQILYRIHTRGLTLRLPAYFSAGGKRYGPILNRPWLETKMATHFMTHLINKYSRKNVQCYNLYYKLTYPLSS